MVFTTDWGEEKKIIQLFLLAYTYAAAGYVRGPSVLSRRIISCPGPELNDGKRFVFFFFLPIILLLKKKQTNFQRVDDKMSFVFDEIEWHCRRQSAAGSRIHSRLLKSGLSGSVTIQLVFSYNIIIMFSTVHYSSVQTYSSQTDYVSHHPAVFPHFFLFKMAPARFNNTLVLPSVPVQPTYAIIFSASAFHNRAQAVRSAIRRSVRQICFLVFTPSIYLFIYFFICNQLLNFFHKHSFHHCNF